MNGMISRIKKYICAIFIILAIMATFAGCNAVKSDIDYGFYENEQSYKSGNFEYTANEIDNIELNWHSGKINILRSDKENLSVSENNDKLEESQQLHYFIDGSTIKINYCKSRYVGKIDEKQKNILVEIPEKINLDINTLNSDVSADDLSLSNLDIKIANGSLNVNTLESDKMDFNISNGSLNINTLRSDEIAFNISNGSLNVNTLESDKMNATVGNGRTSLGVAKCNLLDLNTFNGDVEITLLDNLGAEVLTRIGAGEFKTEKEYVVDREKKIFGSGECKIITYIGKGNLKVK